MSPAKKRNNLNASQRLEMGKKIVEDKLSTADAAKQFGCGFSTAGACATAYRRGLQGKVIPKKTPTAKTIGGIRYDAEFKAKAVQLVLNNGKERLTHVEVAEKLGCSPSGVRKWVVAFDNSGETLAPALVEDGESNEGGTLAPAVVNVSPALTAHRTPSQELEIIKEHARELKKQLEEQKTKILLLNEEIELLKPLARKYLKL